MARPRRRSTPSRRFNAGAMIGDGGEDTELLCGRDCDGFEKENFTCAQAEHFRRYILEPEFLLIHLR
jgi:hypothetical protein